MANKLSLFMQAGEAGPDFLRLGLDGDEAVEQHRDGVAGLDRFVEHREALTTTVSNKPRRETWRRAITAWRSESVPISAHRRLLHAIGLEQARCEEYLGRVDQATPLACDTPRRWIWPGRLREKR